MYLELYCEVCGKGRGIHGGHSKCSKQLQELHKNKKQPKKNKMTKKRLQSLIKFVELKNV